MKNKLYLGIDVSKGYADLIMLNAARKVVGKPFQLYDVSEDHKSLAQYIQSVYYEYSPEHIKQPWKAPARG